MVQEEDEDEKDENEDEEEEEEEDDEEEDDEYKNEGNQYDDDEEGPSGPASRNEHDYGNAERQADEPGESGGASGSHDSGKRDDPSERGKQTSKLSENDDVKVEGGEEETSDEDEPKTVISVLELKPGPVASTDVAQRARIRPTTYRHRKIASQESLRSSTTSITAKK